MTQLPILARTSVMGLTNCKLVIIQLNPKGSRSRELHRWAAGKCWVSGKQLEREKRGAKRKAKSDCRKRKVPCF